METKDSNSESNISKRKDKKKIFRNKLDIKAEPVDKKICKSCFASIFVVGDLKGFKCPKCGVLIND